MHRCTDSDLAEFSPLEDQSVHVFNNIMDDEERGFYCIDWSEEIRLYGYEGSSFYQALELILLPCNYLHTYLGYTEDKIADGCHADLQAQRDYLGPINFIVYANDEVFD